MRRFLARLRDKTGLLLPPRLKRGTPRNPGADLSLLPVGFDLRGISMAEGVRAALACAAVILLYEWLRWPPLLYMALAANLTCFSDVGGPLRPRLISLIAFTVLGGLIWSSFGLLRPVGLPVVVPLACLVIFCTGFARIWGLPAMAIGNVLTVVLVFSLDQPLDLENAVLVAAMFMAGGAWATLLALVVWRLDPYRLAHGAVAEVWRLLAALAADIQGLARRADVSPAEWEAHPRAHWRPAREAIEEARRIVMDLIRMRGSMSLRGSQALLRLEAGEQLFGALIALSNLLEAAETPTRREEARRLLRLLQPLLIVLARSMRTDAAPALPRLERVVARLVADSGSDPALQRLRAAIVDRLRVVLKLLNAGDFPLRRQGCRRAGRPVAAAPAGAGSCQSHVEVGVAPSRRPHRGHRRAGAGGHLDLARPLYPLADHHRSSDHAAVLFGDMAAGS